MQFGWMEMDVHQEQIQSVLAPYNCLFEVGKAEIDSLSIEPEWSYELSLSTARKAS